MIIIFAIFSLIVSMNSTNDSQNSVDNALDMAIAMRFTQITDDFDKGLDVTFHPADNKHLLRLAVDDVTDGFTVLTKRDNVARLFFHVRLDTL